MASGTKLGSGGRVVIPVEYRAAMGLEEGDPIVFALEPDGLKIRSRRDAVKQAQALVRRKVDRGRSLSDELSAERKREAARER